MISETRRLVFTSEAVIDAMRLWFQTARREEMPAGYIKTGQVRNRPELHLVLTVQAPDMSDAEEHRFNADQVGAALITYCVHQQIPLPKEAEKSLERHGDNLCLVIQRSVARTPLHQLF